MGEVTDNRAPRGHDPDTLTPAERRRSLGVVMAHMMSIGLTLGLTFPLTSLTQGMGRARLGRRPRGRDGADGDPSLHAVPPARGGLLRGRARNDAGLRGRRGRADGDVARACHHRLDRHALRDRRGARTAMAGGRRLDQLGGTGGEPRPRDRRLRGLPLHRLFTRAARLESRRSRRAHALSSGRSRPCARNPAPRGRPPSRASDRGGGGEQT